MAAKKTKASENGANGVVDVLDRAKGSAGWLADPNRSQKNHAALQQLEAAESPAVAKIQQIVLPRLDIRTIKIRVVGDSALITHAWSEKAKKQMLDKQMGIASAGKENKDPEKDYQDSMYRYPGGGYGFPAIAFKNAAVSACTSLGKSVTKVAARQAFHVVGELVKIDGIPSMREDMVKIAMGTADIRYRAEFKNWKTMIEVRYNARVLSAEQIANLFNTAGFAVGVGEWRSERDGSFGLFHVE